MRRAFRTDDNHRDVADALRALGCSVYHTAGVGKGFPDLVVGYRNRTFLIEIKDGSKPESARHLTPEQQAFFATYRGEAYIVTTVEEALRAATGKP